MIVMPNLKVYGKKYLYLTINFLHRVAHFWFPSHTWRRFKLAKKRGWSMLSPVIDNLAQKNSTSAHVWCWYIDLSHFAVVNCWSVWSYYERNCQGKVRREGIAYSPDKFALNVPELLAHPMSEKVHHKIWHIQQVKCWTEFSHHAKQTSKSLDDGNISKRPKSSHSLNTLCSIAASHACSINRMTRCHTVPASRLPPNAES